MLSPFIQAIRYSDVIPDKDESRPDPRRVRADRQARDATIAELKQGGAWWPAYHRHRHATLAANGLNPDHYYPDTDEQETQQ